MVTLPVTATLLTKHRPVTLRLPFTAVPGAGVVAGQLTVVAPASCAIPRPTPTAAAMSALVNTSARAFTGPPPAWCRSGSRLAVLARAGQGSPLGQQLLAELP